MYAYEKLMQEHNLKPTELPKDAQIGIKSIKQIENAIKMTEARGQKVSQATKDKLQANDKWVTGEILAFLDEDETDDDLPHEAEEVIEEIKEEAEESEETDEPDDNDDSEQSGDQKLGYDIDAELHNLYEQGKRLVKLDEIKNDAPKTYKHIFETYDAEEENGVITSKYKFVESDEEMMFNLQKR